MLLLRAKPRPSTTSPSLLMILMTTSSGICPAISTSLSARGIPFYLDQIHRDGADQQGGYINFEVDTSIPESDLKSAFRTYLRLKVTARPLLQQVPYDNGTVNFSYWMRKTPMAAGQCAKPKPFRQNSAIFSAKLTPEQAVILEAAFSEMQAPAAVAYNLTHRHYARAESGG